MDYGPNDPNSPFNNNEPRVDVDYNPIMESTTPITSSLFARSFTWMFLGILATAIFAWITYSSGLALKMILSGSLYGLMIAEIVVVLVFSLAFKKLSSTVVGILFAAYSMINGFTLSIIFYAYEFNSIIYLFGVTAGIFGILALIGKNTERDLTSFGNLLSMFLLGGIVLSLINLLLKNTMLDIILDWFILAVFFGVTVYDVGRLKKAALFEDNYGDKLHIYFAMQLYLDFINIFLRILSRFGKRRN